MKFRELEQAGFALPKWPVLDRLKRFDYSHKFWTYQIVVDAPPGLPGWGYPFCLDMFDKAREQVMDLARQIITIFNSRACAEQKIVKFVCNEIITEVEEIYRQARFVCYADTDDYLPREIVALGYDAIASCAKQLKERLQFIQDSHQGRLKSIIPNWPDCSDSVFLINIKDIRDRLQGSPLSRSAVPWGQLGQSVINELNTEKNGTTIYPYLSDDLKPQ